MGIHLVNYYKGKAGLQEVNQEFYFGQMKFEMPTDICKWVGGILNA